MKVSGAWLLHAGGQALCAALEAGGFQALFVGGCVRNALIDRPVGDIDIATDATPLQVTETAKAAGFKTVPTGIDHGTVTVNAGGRAHEVTTFRRDVETDGRRAVVAFSGRIEEDAARRDFTINALYADRHGEVIDPLAGIGDLLDRRVRFVGDPETRIREDYLRILRFFRFHAVYGDPGLGLDAEGLAASAALADGLGAISRERIGAEMRKLLAAADPAPAMAAMAQSGVLARILPGADPQALAPLVHLEADTTPDTPPDWLRRMATLGGEDVAQALRLSRAEERDLAALREAIGGTASPAVLGHNLGRDRALDAVLLRAAVLGQPIDSSAQPEITRGAASRFPVTAADLMPALEGEALGKRLKELHALWIGSNLTASRDDLLRT